MEVHAVNYESKEKTDYSLGKTLEEWEAIEQAERKTFKGKIKYFWQDYIYHPLYRVVHRITDIPGNIRAFWQRGRRGWADTDAWSIDTYLSSFVPEMLHYMIDEETGGGMSYPAIDEANTARKWQYIVKKIARGFEAGRKMDDLLFKDHKDYIREYKKLEKQQTEGLLLFSKWYSHLWD